MTQYKLKLNDDKTEALLMKLNRTIQFFLTLSPHIFVLALPTFHSRPALSTSVSLFQITLLTDTFQLSAVLLTWKSDTSALSTSIWLLKQPKRSSVPLFSPSKTIVILFYPADNFTFSVYNRNVRTLQQNWFSKHAVVIMCSLFFQLFI